MNSNTKFFLTLMFIAVTLAIAGTMEFQEDLRENERAAHASYCERYLSGLIPNYRDLDCGQNERNLSGVSR